VDQTFPPVGSSGYFLYVYEDRYAPSYVRHLRVVAVYPAWPWLTLGALMVFRASMRRAKVRTVHVLRCTLYGCDAAPWLAAGAAVAVTATVDRFDVGRYTGYSDVAVAALVFGLATTWRLSAGYRHYLRFDHPVATAAASQVVVVLVVWVYCYTLGFSLP
jgi:hypothetical protein